VSVARSLVLFAVAALAEIGGAWLIWQGVREQRGPAWIGAGLVALGLYGFAATLQPSASFGRVLAAYGGVFVAGSLPGAWSPTGSGPTGTTSRVRRSACSASRSSCTPPAGDQMARLPASPGR
jgi:small multidrug resistance family-3 protein